MFERIERIRKRLKPKYYNGGTYLLVGTEASLVTKPVHSSTMKYFFIPVLLYLVSCDQPSASPVVTPQDQGKVAAGHQQSRIQNALAFINGYVTNCNQMKNAMGVVEWVEANPLASEGLKSELKRTMEEALRLEPEVGLDADPLFDAQDYPEKGFEFESVDESSNIVVVKGVNRPDFKVRIKMIQLDTTWLVDGCGMINIPVEKWMQQCS